MLMKSQTGPAGDANHKMWFIVPRNTLDPLMFIGTAVRRDISVVGGWYEFKLRQERHISLLTELEMFFRVVGYKDLAPDGASNLRSIVSMEHATSPEVPWKRRPTEIIHPV